MGEESASAGQSSSFLDQLRKSGPSQNICTVEESKRRELWGNPNSDLIANTGGKVNINACSRPRPLHTNPFRRATPDDPYCVGGKPYLNAEDVPGNQPEALTDSKGNPVLGSDGKPVFGPADGVNNLDNMANKMDSNWTSIGRYQDLQKFKRGVP